MKTCRRCKEEQAIECFRQWPNWSRGGRIVTDSYCFSCRSLINQESLARQRKSFEMLNQFVREGNRPLAMKLRKELLKRG